LTNYVVLSRNWVKISTVFRKTGWRTTTMILIQIPIPKLWELSLRRTSELTRSRRILMMKIYIRKLEG
jgi:hypothetical protein